MAGVPDTPTVWIVIARGKEKVAIPPIWQRMPETPHVGHYKGGFYYSPYGGGCLTPAQYVDCNSQEGRGGLGRGATILPIWRGVPDPPEMWILIARRGERGSYSFPYGGGCPNPPHASRSSQGERGRAIPPYRAGGV